MSKQTIMAIGAHADDIELNIGGTLLKYRDAGYNIVYVMSTNNFSGGWATLNEDGTISHRKPSYLEIEPQRKLEAGNAAKRLKAEIIHLDHPQRHYMAEDGNMVEVRYGSPLPKGVPAETPTILTACEHKPSIAKLADLILEHEPEAIITHGCAAGNPEHFATSLLVGNAFWQAQKQGHDGVLLQWMELCITVHGPLNRVWHTFVDISGYEQKRLELIGEHACQIPNPSRLDLPEWGPACGCDEAEVFAMISAGTKQAPDSHDAFLNEIFANRR